MKQYILFFLAFLLLAGGCSTLTLKPADFAWPIESVLKVDNKGFINDERYKISVNVKSLLFTETQDSINVSKVVIRLIRDTRGYFFITGPKFKNVYVFEQTDGGLKLANTIKVSQTGLNDPALNQRIPNIQLVDANDPPVLLSKEGIVEGVKK